MKSILKVWNNYIDNTTNDLHTSDWKQWSQESVNRWSGLDFPLGEDWKYVDFKTIRDLDIHFPSKEIQNSFFEDDSQYVYQVNNFTNSMQTFDGKLPDGLKIEKEMDLLSRAENEPLDKREAGTNPFISVSQSFMGLGMCVEFSSEYKKKKPLKIVLNMGDFNEDNLFLNYNIHIKSYSDSNPHVLIEIHGVKFSGLANINLIGSVGENCTLSVVFKEKGGEESHFVVNHSYFIERNGFLNVFDLTGPSLWSRHNLDVDLEQEGAGVNLSGIYLNNNNNFIDHHTAIRHKKGHTESMEDYRGILNNKAKAVFNGKIIIEPKAAKSNSNQINKNLMLSSQAEVDTKPELQIYNDDVKAAHGATIGQLDDDQKFYLQSRGYSENDANQILARAFVFDLLEQQTQVVQDFINDEVSAALNQVRGNLG